MLLFGIFKIAADSKKKTEEPKMDDNADPSAGIMNVSIFIDRVKTSTTAQAAFDWVKLKKELSQAAMGQYPYVSMPGLSEILIFLIGKTEKVWNNRLNP